MALKAGSLVASIVQKVGTYDQQVLDESLEKLSKKSGHLKRELYELVKDHYVEFTSHVTTTVALEQRVKDLRLEHQKLATQIEEELANKIAQSRGEKEGFESKLAETRSRIQLVQQLVNIYHALEASKAELQSDRFLSAAQSLCKATESLSEMAGEGCEAKVFTALKSEYAQVTSDLTLKLQEKWQGFVSWSPKILPSEPNLNVLCGVELHIPSHSPTQDQQRGEVVAAMKLLTSADVWEQRVRLFAQTLLQRVIKPLIVHPSLEVCQLGNKKGELVLSLRKLPEDSGTMLPELYDMLVLVLTAMSRVVSKEHKEEWLRMLGENLRPEVEELIVAHRLSTSIPRSSAELAEYETVRAKTEAFEATLADLGVGRVSGLSEFTADVNVHFVSQKSQDMLAKARSILLQPIHDTVMVGKVDPFAKLQDILPAPSPSQDLDHRMGELDIGSLTFSFPQCAVSSCVQEFIDHLYKTLEECARSAEPSATAQLFRVARSMVELFRAVLFTQHRRATAELPRVAALQHNNCLYLAHHLVTLGHQFHSRLPPPLNSQASTFVDQVPLVRSLGEECFLSETRKQSVQLLEFLKSFATFSDVSRNAQRERVRHALQGALLHVGKLSKVYLEVLPPVIHHKAMGGLVDVLLVEILRMVLSMEDITADDATELHTILSGLMDRVPPVLMLSDAERATESAGDYCKSWERMKRLLEVLNAATLEDVVDMWDHGKGELAQEFSVRETRGLIKALFSNTERRARALNKITSA